MSNTPKTRPWDVEVIPDLFGYNLHVEGRKFHIPTDQLLGAIKALCFWLKPSDPATKVFLKELATQHGIATEDLFPGGQDG